MLCSQRGLQYPRFLEFLIECRSFFHSTKYDAMPCLDLSRHRKQRLSWFLPKVASSLSRSERGREGATYLTGGFPPTFPFPLNSPSSAFLFAPFELAFSYTHTKKSGPGNNERTRRREDPEHFASLKLHLMRGGRMKEGTKPPHTTTAAFISALEGGFALSTAKLNNPRKKGSRSLQYWVS